MSSRKVGQKNRLYWSLDMKPSTPPWTAMKTRGLLDIRAPLTPISPAMGSNFSQASASFSGSRYMSSMMPLRPRKKSPTRSKGGWVAPVHAMGNPPSFSLRPWPRVAITLRSAA